MSGSTIGGVLGAVVGSFVGQPAIGYMIGSALGAALFPDQVDGPRLEDLRPQASDYGRPIPIIYGTAAVGGNVDWAAPEFTIERGSDGGKGGDSPTADRAYADFAVLVCKARADRPMKIGRIWAGPEKRLIWDGATLEGGGTLTVYDGTDAQLPDPLIESYRGVGNVPAYRGYVRLVFGRFPLANDGNRIPWLTVEAGNVSNAPTNLGQAFCVGIYVNEAAGTYIALIYGGGSIGAVTIARSLADHSKVAEYQVTSGNSLFLNAYERFFVDEDRNRIVQVHSGGLRFQDLGTGAVTYVNDPDWLHVPMVASFVPVSRSGVDAIYHNGLYVCVTGSDAAGNFTVSAIDPDTLAAVWSYNGNSGSTDRIYGPVHHVNDSDAFIFAHRADGKIVKIPLSAGFVAVVWGQSVAPVAPGWVWADRDPFSTLVWSRELVVSSSTDWTLTVTASDLATGALVHTEVLHRTDLYLLGLGDGGGNRTFAFTPTSVLIPASVKSGYAHDYIFRFDRTATLVEEGPMNPESSLVGLNIGPGFWDAAQNAYWFYRGKSGWINRSMSDLVGLDDVPIGEAGDADHAHYLGEADLTAAGEPLSGVVLDLCSRAGLDASEVDVSALTGTVDGYVLADQVAVRDAIGALMKVHNFAAVESGGVLKFVPLGGPVVATVPDADLGAYVAGSQPPDDLLTTRQMEDELPKTLTVQYINRNRDYDVMTRYATRLVGASGSEAQLQLPMVLSDTKAQEVAETNLHRAWVARLKFAFTLPRKYAYLEPTDVVSVRGQSMLLTKITQDDGVFKCEAICDEFNYSPNVIVTETPPSGKTVYVPSETILELM